MKIKSNSTNKEPLTKMHNVELSEVVRKPSTRKTWRVNPSKLVRNAVVAGAAAAVLILSTNGNSTQLQKSPEVQTRVSSQTWLNRMPNNSPIKIGMENAESQAIVNPISAIQSTMMLADQIQASGNTKISRDIAKYAINEYVKLGNDYSDYPVRAAKFYNDASQIASQFGFPALKSEYSEKAVKTLISYANVEANGTILGFGSNKDAAIKALEEGAQIAKSNGNFKEYGEVLALMKNLKR
ncbi:MAG: hypothetical protein M1122_02270 [Candidatus Marsarchaeota archaeon]|jgi:hypothetical protein|nr:hypothetical protein [Candidatus Marsarchaeota archaeon]